MNSLCSMEMTGRARGKPSLDLLGWGVPVPAQMQEKSWASGDCSGAAVCALPSRAFTALDLSSPFSCSFCPPLTVTVPGGSPL